MTLPCASFGALRCALWCIDGESILVICQLRYFALHAQLYTSSGVRLATVPCGVAVLPSFCRCMNDTTCKQAHRIFLCCSDRPMGRHLAETAGASIVRAQSSLCCSDRPTGTYRAERDPPGCRTERCASTC